MMQPDLFDVPARAPRPIRARARDPRTSHAAAATVSKFAAGHYALILGALRKRGRMTVAEIAAALAFTEAQVNKRLPELLEAKRVELTGETRPGPSGRQQRVWRAV